MLSLLHLLKSSGPPSALQPPGPSGTPSVLQPPGSMGPGPAEPLPAPHNPPNPHQSSSLLNPQASHHSCSLQHSTPSMTDSPSLCCLFPPATLIKLLERVFILSPHITRIPLWSCQLPVTSPSAPAPRWAPELSLSCRGSVCGQLPHVRGARACAWWHFGGLAVSQHRGAPPFSVTSSPSSGTFPSARDESRKQARGIMALHSCVALGIAQSRCY